MSKPPHNPKHTFVCPNYDCRSHRMVLTGGTASSRHDAVNIATLCLDCGMEHVLQITSGKQTGLTAIFWAPPQEAVA